MLREIGNDIGRTAEPQQTLQLTEEKLRNSFRQVLNYGETITRVLALPGDIMAGLLNYMEVEHRFVTESFSAYPNEEKLAFDHDVTGFAKFLAIMVMHQPKEMLVCLQKYLKMRDIRHPYSKLRFNGATLQPSMLIQASRREHEKFMSMLHRAEAERARRLPTEIEEPVGINGTNAAGEPIYVYASDEKKAKPSTQHRRHSTARPPPSRAAEPPREPPRARRESYGGHREQPPPPRATRYEEPASRPTRSARPPPTSWQSSAQPSHGPTPSRSQSTRTTDRGETRSSARTEQAKTERSSSSRKPAETKRSSSRAPEPRRSSSRAPEPRRSSSRAPEPRRPASRRAASPEPASTRSRHQGRSDRRPDRDAAYFSHDDTEPERIHRPGARYPSFRGYESKSESEADSGSDSDSETSSVAGPQRYARQASAGPPPPPPGYGRPASSAGPGPSAYGPGAGETHWSTRHGPSVPAPGRRPSVFAYQTPDTPMGGVPQWGTHQPPIPTMNPDPAAYRYPHPGVPVGWGGGYAAQQQAPPQQQQQQGQRQGSTAEYLRSRGGNGFFAGRSSGGPQYGGYGGAPYGYGG